VWNKQLRALASGRQAEKNVKVIACAKYLLKMRTAGPVTAHSSLLHLDKYYSFEEDLYHHIHEAMMILSTGCPTSFFSNPFVKDWLRHLDPKHRPVYRLELLRIIRCIIDVLQNEVNAISLCT
jgi:hypothetical protein